MRRQPVAVCALAAGLLLSGCASSPAAGRFAEFSRATSLLETNVLSAFDTVNAASRDASAAALVVDYDTRGFQPDAVRPLFTPGALSARRTVLAAFSAYARSLAEMASDAPLDRLDASIKDAGSAVLGLSRNDEIAKLFTVPKDDVKLATTALDALGRFLIDAKRRSELPRLVTAMQPNVAALANLLVADIGSLPSEGKAGSGLRDISWKAYDRWLRAQDTLVQTLPKGNADRRDAIARLPVIVAQRSAADTTLEATQSSVRRLPATHAKLADAWESQDPALDDLLAGFLAETRRLRDYYDRVK